MNPNLFYELEQSIRGRNPILADRLQEGRPAASIERVLVRAGVVGLVAPIVALFSWKDGSHLDPSVDIENASVFPRSAYMFEDFDTMLSHFRGFDEIAEYHPRMREVAKRFFPIFWDGATGWIAVDLDLEQTSRVVLIQEQSDAPITLAYRSFDEFLTDAIRANREDDRLQCFW